MDQGDDHKDRLAFLEVDEAMRRDIVSIWPIVDGATPGVMGRFDANDEQSIRRMGLVHHKIGLEPRWYIGGYAFVLNEIVRHLARRHRIDGAALGRKIEGLSKVVMLDMDYAVSVYRRAGAGRPAD